MVIDKARLRYVYSFDGASYSIDKNKSINIDRLD